MHTTTTYRRALGALTALLAVGGFASNAFAVGEIIAPTSAVINSGGPGYGSITHTFNQSGLSAGYTSGVTNFNSYIALNPTHTYIFSGYEWFSNSGTTGAIVTYNFGAVQTIDALALWNEESSGIGKLSLLSSLDGINFSTFASNLIPTDNTGSTYLADVFNFGAVTTQYVRFVITDSPQPNGYVNGGTFPAAAIGEVAFRTGSASVPDAGSTALLLGAGLFGLAALTRKRKVA